MHRARRVTSTARWAALALVAATLAAPTASTQLNRPLHQDGWILAAAHAPGLHGSIWRTDLWVHVEIYGIGALGDLSVVDNATNDASVVREIKKVTYPAP